MSTKFRPSLTKDQLHDIGQRMDARDIPALLWEIARLRAVVMRADQYLDSPNAFVGGVLRQELDECACVREQQAMRLEGSRKE